MALATTQIVQKNLEVPFESMDNLLMAISPMFRERFQQALYDKLESVHRHQDPAPLPPTTTSIDSSTSMLNELSEMVSVSGSKTLPISTSVASTSQLSPSITDSLQPQQQAFSILLQNSLLQNQQHHYLDQQQQRLDLDQGLSQEVLDDLHNWIY